MKVKEIFDEYGSTIVGVTAGALILLLAIGLAFGGDIYQAILAFSKSVC